MSCPAERQSSADWGVGHDERTAQMLAPAARALVDAVAQLAGQQVLYLGPAALLAADAGAHVTAVDPSPRVLSVAAATAAQRGLCLRCEVGVASTLPAADGSVDCVLSNFGVIFAPDAQAAVAEMARGLRPGGRAAVTVWLSGGALAAFSRISREMVQSASGVPPPPAGFPMHDEAAVPSCSSGTG